METLGSSYAEAMISSLNYTLGRTYSAIVDRREGKIKTNIRPARRRRLGFPSSMDPRTCCSTP